MDKFLLKDNVIKAICCATVISVLILIILVTNPVIIYGEGSRPLLNQNLFPLPSDSSNLRPALLDPNPSLIDSNGNLITDITHAANIGEIRQGTVSDGVSKLLIRIPYNSKLQFTIKDRASNDLSDGKLSSLIPGSLGQPMHSSSSVSVDPQRPTNGNPVVIAVYTPPIFFNQVNEDHKVIHVITSDPNNPSFGTVDLPIQIHRVPVILVHGIWETPDNTWIDTNFKNTLDSNGFKAYVADYTAYNAQTFDPYEIPRIGNHGIDTIRKEIHNIINDFHRSSIAISQVDIVGHSMGGLMARGFVQQADYKSTQNFMKGYIHRLVTIGTPHFGAHLAKYLFEHSDDCYYYSTSIVLSRGICSMSSFFPPYEPLSLTTIFDSQGLPIDQGGVEALSPGSTAYSHLCQTNVPSYAIAGSWRSNAINDHTYLQTLYRNILSDNTFDLDANGFHGDNDLLVNILSQAGGLNSTPRLPSGQIPAESELYSNVVHSNDLKKLDQNIFSELDSPQIQRDVAMLLSSPNDKFAEAIGIGATCHIPAHL